MIGVASEQRRMLVVAAVLGGLFLLVLARAAEVTILRGPELAQIAAAQHSKPIPQAPQRGPIVRQREAYSRIGDHGTVSRRKADAAGERTAGF